MTSTTQQNDRAKSIRTKALAFGIPAVLLVAVGAGGAYWLHQRSLPSQASATDCALAQKIIDDAQTQDGSSVVAWTKEMHTLRADKMHDGYLGLQIARYEDSVAMRLTGKGDGASKAELSDISTKANEHCTDSGRTLVFPAAA